MMVTQGWDVNGEARSALAEVVKDYGAAALSDPRILVGLLKDLMPGSPRELSVLTAASEADVPGVLRDRQAQQLSAGAAVTQAAALLEERTALSPDACRWATRLMAETIGLPVASDEAQRYPQTQTWPPADQQIRPTPQPVPPPAPQPVPQPVPPPARSGRVVVAGWAALACALSVPLQLLIKGSLTGSYSLELALFGLVLFAAGMLALAGGSRNLGIGLTFGAPLAVVPNFIEGSVPAGLGDAFVAASAITTAIAVIAGVGSIVYFGSKVRAGNLRSPLAAAYSLAALGFIVADIPGRFQYNSGSGWYTVTGLLGTGVHGWFLFAGIVAVAAIVPLAVLPGFLPAGTAIRAGVIVGAVAIAGAALVGDTLYAASSGVRAATGLYASWALWALVLTLGIALLTDDRRRLARSNQPTLVS